MKIRNICFKIIRQTIPFQKKSKSDQDKELLRHEQIKRHFQQIMPKNHFTHFTIQCIVEYIQLREEFLWHKLIFA